MTRTLQVPQQAARRVNVVRLLGLGTATPASLPQAMASRLAEPLSCDTDQHRQFLERIYSHSGVERRGSVLVDADDPDHRRMRAFYPPRISGEDRGPTTSQRMALYAQFAPQLAERAAGRALQHADARPETITHLIPATCTGFFSPGLDVELIRRLGLSPGVQRAQVGFMGCHGAFNALAAARSIAIADADARVLVCCVELCSLHMAYGFDPQKLIANSLFADGAAAAVIGSTAGPVAAPSLLASATMLIPDSLDAMTWRIGDHGFEMTLSPQVPQLVGKHLLPWVESWLATEGTSVADLDSLAVHPGGPKVLTAVTDALGVEGRLVDCSRQVLAEHGNMSSATVLFVLQRLLETGANGQCLALGFGPGLTSEGMLLEL